MQKAARAPNILIVDSDAHSRARLERLLASSELAALSLESLPQARKVMRAAYFPLVILDRDLGDEDGRDLCREYRARHFGKHVRILMLSAAANSSGASSALASGADDYLDKSSTDAELHARILRLYAIACGPPPTAEALDAETARVQELRALHILDTAPEDAFDDITRIAALVCDAPMAMVSLVDERRQWFKSAVGLAVREVPREQAFTTYAIAGESVFVVSDASADPRFADSPLVRGRASLRFYAGAPLITARGIAVGALCVMDRKPRGLDEKPCEILQALARQVGRLLEARRGLSELEHALVAQQVSNADLLRAHAMFQKAFENAPIGVALVSIHGRWLRVNRALCELVGYSEEELLQTDFQAITHPDDLEADLKLVADMLEGRIERYAIEKRYIHRAGNVVHISLNVSLVRDDQQQPLYFVSQIQDVTERKQLERARSEFVGVVSHELRTPVTSIRGSLGLLAANAAGPLPQKVRDLVELADRNAQRLHRLIDDLLDLEKMEAGHFRYELGLFEVDGFVDRAVSIMTPYASQFRVRLEKVTPPISIRIKADEKRIQQVMTNLIANAVKYSPSDGEVQICAKRLSSTVRFEVRDFGPGIPKDFQGTIFQRFAQSALPPSVAVSSSGLGLSICKNIIEAHGGQIGFDTEQNVGTTFWFEIGAIGDRVR